MDTVTLIGENADGSRDVLGTISMPPKMKIREIARSYFGESACEGDEADMCIGALEELHSWMVKQGWQLPPMVITKRGEGSDALAQLREGNGKADHA